jgi:hypothetical protein
MAFLWRHVHCYIFTPCLHAINLPKLLADHIGFTSESALAAYTHSHFVIFVAANQLISRDFHHSDYGKAIIKTQTRASLINDH